MMLNNGLLAKKCSGAYTTLLARYRLKRLMQRKKKQDQKIRVGFVVQMPEIWDKEKPVYDTMNHDKRFETLLIVVPSYNFADDRIGQYGTEWDFFREEQYHNNVVKAIGEAGNVINLTELHLDYVFLQRPYDHYLPRELRSGQLLRYAKTCYIPYGYVGSSAFHVLNTNKAFFKNIYFSFSDSDTINKMLLDKFQYTVKNGMQHFESLGYPALEKYFGLHFSNGKHEVLWTPRWSTDAKVGGSHFIEYRQMFLKLAGECSEIKFTFRPHPLMFDHLIKNDIMSREEVAMYQEELKRLDIRYSMGEDILNDFSSAEILVTDFSSIIIEYFLTGRPLIYCPASYELNEAFSKMLPGIYVAKNWKEINDTVKMLLAGQDTLKEKRKSIIQEFYQTHSGAALRIVECIASDAIGK